MFALRKLNTAHLEPIRQANVEPTLVTVLPSYGANRRGLAILPLLLIVGLHLLVVLLWTINEPAQGQGAARQRHFTLVLIPPVKPRASVAPATPARTFRDPAVRFRTPSAASTAPAISIPAEIAPAESPAAEDAPATADVSSMIDAARRQAGAIDRELRGGKPAPMEPQADHPMARFRVAVESAYIDRSRSMSTDVLTQPDGVTVYRFRRGGKTWCRQSGGGGPGMLEHSDGAKLAGAGSQGGGSAAGSVQCPGGDAAWKRL